MSQQSLRLDRVRKLGTIAAFLAIYVLWGSTYLAVALGLRSFPPLLLMGLRSLAGGAILLAWAFARHGAPPSRAWLHAGICGVFFFVGCHGVLAYAQQRVESGVAAIMLATIPFWITLINFAFLKGDRATAKTVFALVPGFAGVAFIASEQAADGKQPGELAGILLLLGSALSWAIGSVLSRRRSPDTSALTLSGMQLTVGGGALLTASVVAGEPQTFVLAHVSASSVGALAYLTLAGAVIAFAAYIWLLDTVSTSLVSTYTFVNPVIAVLLGWIVLDERPASGMLLGAAFVLGSVVAVWLMQRQPVRKPDEGRQGRLRRRSSPEPALE